MWETSKNPLQMNWNSATNVSGLPKQPSQSSNANNFGGSFPSTTQLTNITTPFLQNSSSSFTGAGSTSGFNLSTANSNATTNSGFSFNSSQTNNSNSSTSAHANTDANSSSAQNNSGNMSLNNSSTTTTTNANNFGINGFGTTTNNTNNPAISNPFTQNSSSSGATNLFASNTSNPATNNTSSSGAPNLFGQNNLSSNNMFGNPAQNQSAQSMQPDSPVVIPGPFKEWLKNKNKDKNEIMKELKISLNQLRFYEYIENNEIKDPKFYSKPPDKVQSASAQGALGQNANKGLVQQQQSNAQQPVVIDYKDVLKDIPVQTAVINTSASYFIPSKRVYQPREAAFKATASAVPAVKALSKKSKQDYDFLFEATIPKSSQVSFSDKKSIIISTEQLQYGEPQNYDGKIEVYENQNRILLLRKEYGSIDFLSKNLKRNGTNGIDLSSIFTIERCVIDIKPDKETLSAHFGLNFSLPAIITLEKVWPRNPLTNFRDKHDMNLTNYEEELREYCSRHFDPFCNMQEL